MCKNIKRTGILKSEVKSELAKLYRKKAAGLDGIVIEMLAADSGIYKTTNINKIYDSFDITEDLC